MYHAKSTAEFTLLANSVNASSTLHVYYLLQCLRIGVSTLWDKYLHINCMIGAVQPGKLLPTQGHNMPGIRLHTYSCLMPRTTNGYIRYHHMEIIVGSKPRVEKL